MFDDLLVRYWQCAWMSQGEDTHIGVGVVAVCIGVGAVRLGRSDELCVHLQANDELILHAPMRSTTASDHFLVRAHISNWR